MSSMSEWRTHLSFTQRLSNVTKLAKAIQEQSDITSSQAHQKAAKIEENIHANAPSQEEYHSQCEGFTSGTQATAAVASSAEEKSPAANAAHGDMTWNDMRLPPSPVTIGRYTHAHHHRDGLFSTVYKAYAPANGASKEQSSKVVALKVTSPAMMVAPHDSAREARILQHLNHPNITPLLDVFQQAGGKLILAFPFMQSDLKAVLSSGDVAAQDQIISHLGDLFSALDYLHSQALIHRDVKPSNVLLRTPRGPAYLADFGIAWSAVDKDSEPAEKKITDVGTTCYRPPELLFGNRKYGCALDLWAAGCVVAEACLERGQTLFDAGELGSELALIKSIFQSLGTPSTVEWPEAVEFPDWGKMEFRKFPPQPWEDLLPGSSPQARDLVSKLVRYQSTDRLSASLALQHPYFGSYAIG